MTASTPTWAALHFENVSHLWIWVVLTVVGAGVLVWTYRQIFQRSERRLTWALMLLRGAGLLALLLALAKPTWTRETQWVDAGRVAVVVDNSQSMSLPVPSGESRYEMGKKTAERLRRAFEARRGDAQLKVDYFDIRGELLGKDLPAQPAVERTDLVLALTKTLAGLRSQPLAGVVLISDGVDTIGRQEFGELGDVPVPVYTIGYPADPGAENLDFAVRRVQAPERALVNNDVQVEVLVSKTRGPASGATVTLKRGTEEVGTPQKLAFRAGNEEQQVRMTLKPTQAGSFVFTATITADVGETVLANNSRHFPLRVDAEPIRVLYLEGFLRYEYKFLKSRLEDDPDIGLVSVVRRANSERAEARGQNLVTPERLKNIDVVILGDMEANYLSPAEYRAMIGWLEEQRHALLVLGGYHSFGPDGFRTTPLADVLAVVFAETPPYQSELPFTLQLTEEGQRHPIFALSSDRVRDAASWAAAPPLLGSCLVQRAKPGAVVLAEDPKVVIDGMPAVVLAVQRYGAAGQTMVLTADTTWRWSRLPRVLGQADTLYARFWSQTLRWLSGRSLDDQRPLLAVSTDRPDYEVGKQVTVRSVRQARPGTDLSVAEVSVVITSQAGKTVPVPMASSSAEPDVFKGTFFPQEGGRYEIAANLTGQGNLLANQAAEFLVSGPNLELADTRTNQDNLRKIAAATGGEYLDIDKADQVVEKIRPRERKITQVQRSEYWNSPWLFLCFLGAVTAEWFLRRRHHLV
jgi:uncharacterized membrane protein